MEVQIIAIAINSVSNFYSSCIAYITDARREFSG